MIFQSLACQRYRLSEYDDRYHISLGRDTYIFDVQRKYWTSADWNVRSFVWSRGGSENESVPYGMLSSGQLVRLYETTTDDGEQIRWGMGI